MVKKISNTKTWCREGWRYYMMRTVCGKQYASSVIITAYEIHNRHVVAFRLRKARRELRDYCEAKKTYQRLLDTMLA